LVNAPATNLVRQHRLEAGRFLTEKKQAKGKRRQKTSEQTPQGRRFPIRIKGERAIPVTGSKEPVHGIGEEKGEERGLQLPYNR